MKSLFFPLVLALGIHAAAQINIIPQPVEAKTKPGRLTFKKEIKINNLSGAQLSADFLADYLKKYYQVSSVIVKEKKAIDGAVNLQAVNTPRAEQYSLEADGNKVLIKGDEAGGFRGVQSLIQLFPVKADDKLSIPQASITDYPRFEYRGLHLDCGRYFFPVSFVKKYIDYLAYFKLNYFHWHLTDDQGWRIEIKKYPLLTSVGAWRNGTIIGHHPGKGNTMKRAGGFYTQEEVKNIMRYAAARFITVIPEIEMPGHSGAAIAAYPYLSCFPDEPTFNYFSKEATWSGDKSGKKVQQGWSIYSDVFCAGKETTFTLLEGVLDEAASLFPSKYIHIGGDECPKSNWKKCAACQARIKELKLKDEHELQSYFIQRIEKYLNGKGKTIISWDEILEGGLAPNAIVMSWRGEDGGIEAAKQNHGVIMTPKNWCYLDYAQFAKEDSLVIGSYTSLQEVYEYEPIPAKMEASKTKFVLGAQSNVWTEYISNEAKAEYMIFPRVFAMSEVLWSPKGVRDWAMFLVRTNNLLGRLETMKIHYGKGVRITEKQAAKEK